MTCDYRERWDVDDIVWDADENYTESMEVVTELPQPDLPHEESDFDGTDMDFDDRFSGWPHDRSAIVVLNHRKYTVGDLPPPGWSILYYTVLTVSISDESYDRPLISNPGRLFVSLITTHANQTHHQSLQRPYR